MLGVFRSRDRRGLAPKRRFTGEQEAVGYQEEAGRLCTRVEGIRKNRIMNFPLQSHRLDMD